MAHALTQEQLDIITAAGTGQNLKLSAGAGTGKTSTLVELAKSFEATRPGEKVLYLAYNRTTRFEAIDRMPGNTDCHTSGSLSYASVGRKYKTRLDTKARLSGQAKANILKVNDPVRIIDDPTVPPFAPAQLARIAVDTVKRFCYSADAEVSDKHVPRVERVDEPAQRAALAKVIVPIARRAWDDLQLLDGKLEFDPDHVLKMYQLNKPVLRKYGVIMLDEAQDTNECVMDIINRQNCQIILVGDECQPAGTMVTVVKEYRRGNRFTGHVPTRTEQVPIEELQVGDRVVSYNLPHRLLRRTGSTVTGITARPVSENLVKATTTSGLVSRYTGIHHCVVRFGDELLDKHVVYMMRRGSDYRIGITSGRMAGSGKRIGVALRVSQEKADAAWILSVHDSRAEASTAEMVTAWTYGVPTLTFRVGNRNTMTQDHLDLFWSKLGGNAPAAAAALEAHGRSIAYPLWDQSERYLQTRRPTVIRACNLIDGMEMLPLNGAMMANGKGVSRTHWERITVTPEKYTGLVYSLAVEGDHTYVADGVVTHNCQAIYQWRGAINAMKDFPARRLTLSQSFRFGPAVATEANKWLALLGSDLRLRGFDAKPTVITHLPVADAILCRTNAGAMAQVIREMDAGRRVHLVGGGDKIKNLAFAAMDLQAGRPTSHPELFLFQSWGEVQDYVSEDASGSDMKVFVKLIDERGPQTIIDVCKRLIVKEQYADVTVSTAHKAKGREWNRVRIATDFPEPVATEKNPNPVLDAESMRLAYVAVTRGMFGLDRAGLAWVDGYIADHAPHLLVGDLDAEAAEVVTAAATEAAVQDEPAEPGAVRCPRCGSTPCSTCDPAEAQRWTVLTTAIGASR